METGYNPQWLGKSHSLENVTDKNDLRWTINRAGDRLRFSSNIGDQKGPNHGVKEGSQLWQGGHQLSQDNCRQKVAGSNPGGNKV